MKNYYILNIDTSNAVNPNFNFDNLLTTDYYKEFHVNGTGLWIHRISDSYEFIKPNWVEYMSSIGLELAYANIFYRPACQPDEDPHVDSHNNNFFNYALNLVIGIDNSDMVWYDAAQHTETKLHTHPAGRYTTYSKKDLTEIDRHCIGNNLTLVRTDIPHLVELKNNPRWCIGFRTKRASSSWGEIVSYMAPYIKQL